MKNDQILFCMIEYVSFSRKALKPDLVMSNWHDYGQAIACSVLIGRLHQFQQYPAIFSQIYERELGYLYYTNNIPTLFAEGT